MSRLIQVASTAFMTGLATLLTACEPPASGPDLPVAGRPECPRGDTVFVHPSEQDTTWVPRPYQITGASIVSAVHEYHDCQRLIVSDGRTPRYGPLVAIWARFGLEDLGDPIGFEPPPLPTPGGVVSIAPAPTRVILGSSTGNLTGKEMAVATILNYDAEYPPLQIPRGFSCLYVYHSGSVWAARLEQVSSDSECPQPMNSSRGGWDLAVRPILDPNPAPAARWDWDARNQRNYIGIRCGSSWCEVYDPTTTLQSSPVYQIGKGWYDEQHLAVRATTPGQPDDLVPSSSVGTMIPLGPLDQYPEDLFAGEWHPVAQVAVYPHSQVYLDKFNYRAGAAPHGRSLVFLCKGTKSECSIPSGTPVNGCANDGDPWWAMILSGGIEKYRCVVRREHKDVPIPGMVRWRWRLDDEGGWMRCPGGCCEKT